MAEILFYHLTETKLEDTLPALLEKSMARGWKACIHSGSQERLDALDSHLWTYQNDGFLAHGKISENHAEQQPILLTTTSECSNEAQVRFVVDMGEQPDPDHCERIVFMFDGHDQDQLDRARDQWKSFSQSGLEKTYWQQTPDRQWVKKG